MSQPPVANDELELTGLLFGITDNGDNNGIEIQNGTGNGSVSHPKDTYIPSSAPFSFTSNENYDDDGDRATTMTENVHSTVMVTNVDNNPLPPPVAEDIDDILSVMEGVAIPLEEHHKSNGVCVEDVMNISTLTHNNAVEETTTPDTKQMEVVDSQQSHVSLFDARYTHPRDTPMANLMPEEYDSVDVRCFYPHYDKDKPPRFSKLFPPKFELNVYTRGLNPTNHALAAFDAHYDTRPHVVYNQVDYGVWPDPEELLTLTSGEEKNILCHWEPFVATAKHAVKQERESDASKEAKKGANHSTVAQKDQTSNASWRFSAAKIWYDRLHLPENVDIERVFDPRVTQIRGLPWQVELEARANAPSLLAASLSTAAAGDIACPDPASVLTSRTDSDSKLATLEESICRHESPYVTVKDENMEGLLEDEGGVVIEGIVHETRNEETGEVHAHVDDGRVPLSPRPNLGCDVTQEDLPPIVKSEDDQSSAVAEMEDEFIPEKLPLYRLVNWQNDIIWDSEAENREIWRSFNMHAPHAGWVLTDECHSMAEFQKHHAGHIVGIMPPSATGLDQEYPDPKRIRNFFIPPRQSLVDGSWIKEIFWDVMDLEHLPPPVLTTIEPHDYDNWQMTLYRQYELAAMEDYRNHYKKLCSSQVDRVVKSAAGLALSAGCNPNRFWSRIVPAPPPFLQMTRSVRSARSEESRIFHEQVNILLRGPSSGTGGGNTEESGTGGGQGTGTSAGGSTGTHHSGAAGIPSSSSMPTPAAAGPLRFRQPSKAAARMGDHIEKAKKILGRHGLLHEEEEVQESTTNILEEEETCRVLSLLRRDPFNVSLDEQYSYYTSSESQALVAPTMGGMLSAVDVQHSIPALELYPAFFPTYLTEARARHFYRPPLRIRNMRTAKGVVQLFNRDLPIRNLKRYIERRERERKDEQEATGGGQIFIMRKPEDLSAMDGHIVFLEYSEEFPPLMTQPGMASRILNYYRRTFNTDGTEKPPPDLPYGENTFTHKPPFMGQLKAGQYLQSLENRMFRAPIYQHQLPTTDFLVVRARGSFYIRRVETVFTVGQLCPLMEVPAPNSKKAAAFIKDFLKVYIERLFLKSEYDPPRIKIEDVRYAFPNHSETSIRKRLKEVAEFRRTGNDASWWVYKVGVKGMPSEHVLRRLITPEDCCAYYSMMHASQRLKDAGYKAQMEAEEQENEQADEQTKMADEIKAAPWHTTNAFIAAQKGKCFLELHGAADPTGHGEALSYVKISGKTGAQVLRSIAEGNDGLAQWMNQPLPSDVQGVGQPSGYGVGPGRRMVTGTDADLRKLTLRDAKQMLRNHGIPESEIKKLKRWDIVNVVRALSTEKAKKGEQEGMAKFARGGRMSGAELQERYREELQRMFELQNRLLTSDEPLSTDEGSSSEEVDSEAEELGKNVETMLTAVNRGVSAAAALRQKQLQREEAEHRDLFVNRLDQPGASSSKKSSANPDPSSSLNPIEHLLQQPSPPNAVRRELRIKRTYMTPEGTTYTRSQIVAWSHEVDFYLEIRKSWTEETMRQFAGETSTVDKEERRREKRRLQDRLRRIKKQEIEQERRKKMGLPPTPVKTMKKSVAAPGTSSFGMTSMDRAEPSSMTNATNLTTGTTATLKGGTPKKRINQVCGACGIVGHMRTNKCCPLYNQPPGTVLPHGLMPTPSAPGSLGGVGGDSGIPPLPGGGSGAAMPGAKKRSGGKKAAALSRNTAASVLLPPNPDLPVSRELHELQSVTVSDLLRRDIPMENEPLPFEDKDLVSHLGGTKMRIDRRLFSHELEKRRKEMQMRIPKVVLEKINRVEEATQAAAAAAEAAAVAAANQERLAAAQKEVEVEKKAAAGRKKSRPSLASMSHGGTSGRGGGVVRGDNQRGDYSAAEKYSGNRRRINPLVSLNHVIEMICKAIPSQVEGCQYFLQPVSRREYPQYYNFITQPMDLATIRRKAQENEYTSRAEFIEDINLIKANCIKFNGEQSLLADRVEKLVQFVWEQLIQKENKLMRYELMINPLLDEDDVAFHYYLSQATEAMKAVDHSLVFQQPVDKKRYKNYYDIVKEPMDLSKIEEKIKRRAYQSRYNFLDDVSLMVSNCILFNTDAHPLTQTARLMEKAAQDKLLENQDALAELEEKLCKVRAERDQMLDEEAMSQHTGMDTESVFSRPSTHPIDAPDDVVDEEVVYEETAEKPLEEEDDLYIGDDEETQHEFSTTAASGRDWQPPPAPRPGSPDETSNHPDVLGLQLSDSGEEDYGQAKVEHPLDRREFEEPAVKRQRREESDYDMSSGEASRSPQQAASNQRAPPSSFHSQHSVAEDLILSESDSADFEDAGGDGEENVIVDVNTSTNDEQLPRSSLSYLQADLDFSDENSNAEDSVSVISSDSAEEEGGPVGMVEDERVSNRTSSSASQGEEEAAESDDLDEDQRHQTAARDSKVHFYIGDSQDGFEETE